VAVVVGFSIGSTARVQGRVWTTGDDLELAAALKAALPDASGVEPDPNFTAATAALQQLGGGCIIRPDPWGPCPGIP
jgi:hypothetical protein